MIRVATNYLNLITAEHKDSPRFVATVDLSCSAYLQGQSVLSQLPSHFDVDSAVGKQLDTIGEWVGIDRRVYMDILGYYFEFDNEEFSVGWDEGIWKQEFDIDKQATALDDQTYRKVIYAKIATNHWDGTAESLYKVFEETFGGAYHLIIIDHLDMSFSITIAGQRITQLDEALLKGSYIDVHPAGVKVNEINVTPRGGKAFAWDIEENSALGGWDIGEFLRNILVA